MRNYMYLLFRIKTIEIMVTKLRARNSKAINTAEIVACSATREVSAEKSINTKM